MQQGSSVAAPQEAQEEPGEESAARRTGSILPLTGVRGFAAIWVVLYHLRGGLESALPGWDAALAVVGRGYLGVDLFAFLSGFVISYTYGERLGRFAPGAAARYLWRRLARIYPLHLFVLLLFVLALSYLNGESAVALAVGDDRFWLQLFLLNGWGLEDRFGWNAPSWTVSSEWFCYLVFPLLAPALGRVRRGETAVGLALLVFAATLLVLSRVGRPDFDAFLDWGLVRIGGEFAVGCLLFRAHRDGYGRRAPWGWIGLAALAAGLTLCAIWPPAAVASFAVLVYALAQDPAPLRAVFGRRTVVWLGEISYSIYMIHWFVLTVGMALLGEGAGEIEPRLLVGALFATVLAAAAATHLAVERPARSRLRRLVEQRSRG
ncbi:MAG: acyltransferase family protein [Myxococcota bacterium]